MSTAESVANPFLSNIDQPAVEIGQLLQALPNVWDVRHVTSLEIAQQMDAVITHAHNSITSLLLGVQAVGDLISIAADNDDRPVGSLTLLNLGGLIQHIGSEVEFLYGTERLFKKVLNEYQGSPNLRKKGAVQ